MDFILAGDGDDIVLGSNRRSKRANADVLIGGAGSDSLNYELDTVGVTIDLCQWYGIRVRRSATTSIAGFEIVVGGTEVEKITG